jgi:cytochrome c-type biogenesis protein CcmE
MTKRNLMIVVTVLIGLAGLGYVAAQSLGGDAEYYKMVYEVTKNPDPWLAKKTMKIHGFVKAGSIKSEIVDQRTHRSFIIENKGEEIEVRHTGVVPDTFKALAETVVTGRLTREGGKLVLLAVDGDAGVSAKCPSKYNGDQGGGPKGPKYTGDKSSPQGSEYTGNPR